MEKLSETIGRMSAYLNTKVLDMKESVLGYMIGIPYPHSEHPTMQQYF